MPSNEMRGGKVHFREQVLSGISLVRYIATGALLFAMVSGAVGVPEPQQAMLAACGAALAILLRVVGLVR
jgi:hypothetical protein